MREFAAAAANSGRPGDGRDLELGDFAAKQNQGADAFLAAEQGMADMSEKFREAGGEIYVPETS